MILLIIFIYTFLVSELFVSWWGTYRAAPAPPTTFIFDDYSATWTTSKISFSPREARTKTTTNIMQNLPRSLQCCRSVNSVIDLSEIIRQTCKVGRICNILLIQISSYQTLSKSVDKREHDNMIQEDRCRLCHSLAHYNCFPLHRVVSL